MEPAKYTKGSRGTWVISDEWKKWKDAKFKAAKKSKFTPTRLRQVTEENHKYNWKEVVYSTTTGRSILFCCCRANTGESFRGCGAVAIKTSRASKLNEVIKPRFH